jgi:uncharacterized protein (DUF2252 family)
VKWRTNMDTATEEHDRRITKLPTFTRHPTWAERYAAGERLRKKCPRTAHAEWKPSKGRPDPVKLVEEGDKGRIPELVPLRHGRMLASPFTFYRGAALNMAADLATTPTTGIRVQACGDAHLVNFRGFATPERLINFDIHDLDETLPGPWEWDLKRLATSFVVACRENGLKKGVTQDAALTCARSYREHMAEYGAMGALELWYARLDSKMLVSTIDDPALRKRIEKRAEKRIIEARARSALEHDFPKLVHVVGEDAVIRDNPPTIYHLRDQRKREFEAAMRESFARYRSTLADDRRTLLDRFEFRDIAMKVVGVGSVGTISGVLLLMAAQGDPLFLQIKEARASVLEAFAGKSVYTNHGQRVVAGHRLMQSASDIFLGWFEGRRGRQEEDKLGRTSETLRLVESYITNGKSRVKQALGCFGRARRPRQYPSNGRAQRLE